MHTHNPPTKPQPDLVLANLMLEHGYGARAGRNTLSGLTLIRVEAKSWIPSILEVIAQFFEAAHPHSMLLNPSPQEIWRMGNSFDDLPPVVLTWWCGQPDQGQVESPALKILLARMLTAGFPVLLVEDDPAALPDSVRGLADRAITIPSPTVGMVQRMIDHVTGTFPPAIPGALLSLEPWDFGLARRAGEDAEVYVRRLRQIAARRIAKSPSTAAMTI